MLDLISNWPFAAAALLSALTAGIHVFLGGPEAARPLMASEMRRVPKFTNYYCWHLVTITIAAMSLCFLLASMIPGEDLLALIWTMIAGAFTLWSVILFLWKRMHPFALPQWALFGPITGCGIWGFF